MLFCTLESSQDRLRGVESFKIQKRKNNLSERWIEGQFRNFDHNTNNVECYTVYPSSTNKNGPEEV